MAKKAKLKGQRMIGAAKFKEQCLSLIEKVDQDGIIITKNGKPVAKLVPIDSDISSYIGRFADRIKVHGDTLSTGIKWNAES